jgi:Undecaprenyl-phosphate glucose phosphotransferase
MEGRMIKDNQKVFNRIHIIIDGIFVALAYISAYFIRFNILKHWEIAKIGPEERYYNLASMAQYLYFLIPVYIILYSACNLYKSQRSRSKRILLWNLVQANALGIMAFSFALYIIRENEVSRWFLSVFAIMNIVYDIAFRLILTKFLSEFRKRGFNKKHVLIVGYSRAAEGYLDRLAANPQWGYHVYGILDDTMEVGTMYKRVKVIGTTDELERILAENELDEIAVTLSINEYAKLEYIVGICEKSGAHTKFVPDYHNIIPTIPVMEDMNGLPVINIRNVPLNNYVNRLLKRVVDIVGSIVAILLFSIPMLIVALIIKVTSPGPIIFSQIRVGLHNRQFKMYKFRSMVVQTESSEKKAWTTSNDTRVTKIGKFIRKTSIDELPQLFNILMGNMSMVGPRPERPYFVEKFKEEVPRYMIKHQVRPGLTGWAQISGYRGDTSIRKRIEHDLYYIENWSIGLDFKILFLTIFKGFINKNAY